jgi:hypothetical protein
MLPRNVGLMYEKLSEYNQAIKILCHIIAVGFGVGVW